MYMFVGSAFTWHYVYMYIHAYILTCCFIKSMRERPLSTILMPCERAAFAHAPKIALKVTTLGGTPACSISLSTVYVSLYVHVYMRVCVYMYIYIYLFMYVCMYY